MAMSDPSGRPPLQGTPPDPLPLPTARPKAALRRCWRAPCPSTSDASRTSQCLHQRVKPFSIARKCSSRRLGPDRVPASSDQRTGLAHSQRQPNRHRGWAPCHTTGHAGPHPAVRRVEVTPPAGDPPVEQTLPGVDLRVPPSWLRRTDAWPLRETRANRPPLRSALRHPCE